MSGRFGWIVVSLCWAMACGGRYYQRADGDETGGTASSSAGTPSGGSQPFGAAAGSAGTSGSISTGGVTGTSGFGTGGGAVAGTCATGPIGCAPGYIAVTNPDGCSFQCQLDSRECTRQREDYEGYRKAVLYKYTRYECSTNADCLIYYDKNECQVSSCGAVINTSSWMSIESELNVFASMHCNPACPPALVPPCEPPTDPVCFKGVCE